MVRDQSSELCTDEPEALVRASLASVLVRRVVQEGCGFV